MAPTASLNVKLYSVKYLKNIKVKRKHYDTNV